MLIFGQQERTGKWKNYIQDRLIAYLRQLKCYEYYYFNERQKKHVHQVKMQVKFYLEVRSRRLTLNGRCEGVQ